MRQLTQKLANAQSLAWLVVALVGVIVVVLVLALNLFGRLGAGQDVLDEARPAFTEERVAGDRAGIRIVSQIVDLADPITTPRGGAAAEVPQLVAFVSNETGLSQTQVVTTLRKQFPHTTALLQTLPLSSVTEELPGLVGFLTPEVVNVAPRLSQSVLALRSVTEGWNSVPGTRDLTRFDGSRVQTVPDVRSYFAGDVIPVLERQQDNFEKLDELPVNDIAWFLVVIGVGVIAFGLLMAFNVNGGGLTIAWTVVAAAGSIVVALVVGVLQLFPRLNAGQDVVDDLKPALTEERVAGDRAGINMVSQIVNLADPIVTDRGGAAAELPKVIALAARAYDIPESQVMPTLERRFPQAAALLQAIPLSEVTRELPRLVAFLGTTLQLTPEAVNTALADSFPRLSQSIAALPRVTRGWDDVPGTRELTRFDGSPVKTVPDVRDYFAADVIPVLEREQSDFQNLEKPFPALNVFPPLLLGVGLLVVLYGLVMAVLARRRHGVFATS